MCVSVKKKESTCVCHGVCMCLACLSPAVFVQIFLIKKIGRIEVKNFEPPAFQAFLDWLSLSLNISFRQGTDLAQRSQCMSTPHIIRQASTDCMGQCANHAHQHIHV
jgi:hypothetical protein